MSAPDDEMLQLYGRLSMLEFVLEVILANELAKQPAEGSDAFKVALLEKAKPVGTTDTQQVVATHLATGLRRFLEKVDEREHDIRAKTALVLPGQP